VVGRHRHPGPRARAVDRGSDRTRDRPDRATWHASERTAALARRALSRGRTVAVGGLLVPWRRHVRTLPRCGGGAGRRPRRGRRARGCRQ
jgi:hypothetical protein